MPGENSSAAGEHLASAREEDGEVLAAPDLGDLRAL